MDPEYRKHYRELFEKHWWWRARTEWIITTLRRWESPKGWSAILDVGCGEGLFFERLSKLGYVEGVELEEGLPSGSERWRDRIHACPFDESFQPAKKYSLILMLDVLEHLTDPSEALRHVHRLLAPDGIFLVTVPAFQALWTNHDALNHHLRRYTKSALHQLLKNASFQSVQSSYFFQWTCPAKLAVRAAERILARPPKPPAIPPRWINEPLYLLSRAEHEIIRRIPLPFGSSLMVVARKDVCNLALRPQS